MVASYEVTGDEGALGIGLDTCYDEAAGTIASPGDGWGFAEASIALGAEIDAHTTVIGTMKGEIAKIAENTAAQGRQIEAMASRIKEIEGRLAAVETLTAQIEALPMARKQLEAQEAKLQELERRVSTP